MKNKTTKRALIMSVLSLVVCISMLIGTTFAWFTDSVTSANNIIKSGNLDVELEYSTDMTNWTPVTSTTNVFKDGALWEPGYTEVVYLRVSNKGSLALKYELGVNIASEIEGINKAGETFKLSQYIEYGVIEDVTAKYADRNLARAAVTSATKLNAAITKSGSLLAKAEGATEYPSKVVAMVVYMPETVGNEANHNGSNVPQIDLGINVMATQMTYESDSFDEKYDSNATYIDPWNGEPDELPAEVDNVYTIKTPGELAAFAMAVNGTSTYSMRAAATGNSFAGKTVVLGADINLNNEPWTPIGACNTPTYFQGTFDGRGHTIYGLNVDNSTDAYMYSTAGLFGWIDAANATIKNVNLDGATVKGSHWVGGLVGYMTGDVINCSVTNSVVNGVHVNDDADGDKVGGLVGFLNNGLLKNNTVADSFVGGNRDIGGLVGSVTAGQKMTGNTVKNTTVTYITEKTYASADVIVSGRTGFVPDDTNKAENVKVIKGSLVDSGVIESNTRTYDVYTKEGLLNVNELIANSSTGEGNGIKVNLKADINLAGEDWKPINTMWIDFNGNGHTISNLKANAWKAGLFGYLGGGSIKNLTLENVDITGAQAGAFAGAMEGTIDNCFLKGTKNTITWVEKHQFDDPSAAIEAWSGIGAISGVTQPLTVNAEIVSGAVVVLNYNGITTEAPYEDDYTGYISGGNVTNNGEIIYGINSAAGLTGLAKEVNKYSNYERPLEGKTIKLMCNIDLGGMEWTPIGDYRFSANRFCGTFDGQGYTISNFKITKKTDKNDSNKSSYGFFGNVEGTVKNLTIDNAQVCSYAYVGALVGRLNSGSVINCHVKNSAVECTYWQAGGMIGQLNEGCTVSGCTITDSTVTGAAAIGGLIGPITATGSDKTLLFENCSVIGCDIIQKGSFGGSYDALFGGMFADVDVADNTTNINKCTVKDTTVKGAASTVLYNTFGGTKLYVDGVKQ